jgi:parallel beta-helix repeat protein
MNKKAILSIAVLSLMVLPTSSLPRTWRVTPDSSGNAPFLEAAMDSATMGDTVLVAPGQYTLGSVHVTNGIVLRSEAGALQTRLKGQPGAGGGLACSQLNARTEIFGFWFEGLASPGMTGTGAIGIFQCDRILIHDCVFVNNTEAGISVNSEWWTQIERNTFVGNEYSIYAPLWYGMCRDNIFWGPIAGTGQAMYFACNDALNLLDIPAVYRPANFSLDPQFCAAGDYRVMTSSPCAPGNSPLGNGCHLIGALPADCQPLSVQKSTWGAGKALYRD